MATPTLTKHSLTGALGTILVDVRSGGRSTARPAVMVLHGYKGFKDWGMFPPLSDRLARAGFTAVSFNFSGSGVDDAGDFAFPERFGHNTFSAELGDATVVLDNLLQGELGVPPPTSVGLVGHSRGGGIAVLQTARDSRIHVLVTWAAISSVQRWPAEDRGPWRRAGKIAVTNTRTGQVLPLYPDVLDDIDQHGAALDILAAARRIRVPWLLIHGAEDESVRFSEAELLRSAGPPERTRLLAVAGAGHTFGAVHPWQSSTPELDVVFDATLDWLTDQLK
ncbi:MAG: alpha/beta hydrolase [Geminicoccaceae bacterium]|jgi:pimeloyl-ACP methyl ester carboxylesterase|nr:alpha/beta hydrolase [Geminicoccaceae bacterium]